MLELLPTIIHAKKFVSFYPGVHFSIDSDCNKEDLLLAALLLQAVQHDDDLSLTRFDDEMLSDFYSLVEKGKLQTQIVSNKSRTPFCKTVSEEVPLYCIFRRGSTILYLSYSMDRRKHIESFVWRYAKRIMHSCCKCVNWYHKYCVG